MAICSIRNIITFIFTFIAVLAPLVLYIGFRSKESIEWTEGFVLILIFVLYRCMSALWTVEQRKKNFPFIVYFIFNMNWVCVVFAPLMPCIYRAASGNFCAKTWSGVFIVIWNTLCIAILLFISSRQMFLIYSYIENFRMKSIAIKKQCKSVQNGKELFEINEKLWELRRDQINFEFGPLFALIVAIAVGLGVIELIYAVFAINFDGKGLMSLIITLYYNINAIMLVFAAMRLENIYQGVILSFLTAKVEDFNAKEIAREKSKWKKTKLFTKNIFYRK